MRLILHYMKAYSHKITLSMVVKLLGAVTELLIPYILEYLIDEVVPLGKMEQVLLWGSLMIVTALITRQLNVLANRIAVDLFPMTFGRISLRKRPTSPAHSSTHSACRV